MGMWTSKEDKLLISLLKDSSLLEEKPLTYYFPDRKVLGLAGRARYLAKKHNIKIKDPIRLTENRSIFKEDYRLPRIEWNSEEDATVIKKVEQYPTNISYAFKEASKLLPNRKLEAIRSRYYGSLRKEHKYTITTGSQKGFSNNVKNQRIDDGKLTKQELEPVHIVMAQMLNLPEKDRKRLLAFFNC